MGEFADPDALMGGDRLAFGPRIGGRLPRHVRDVVGRPQIRRGIAMAVEAELHGEGFGAIGQRHLIDAAVAGFAADALGDVNVVTEIDVVRQPRDARPGDRLVVGKALADRLQHRGIGPYLGMAGHAGRGRRQPGLRAGLDAGVAITAIDSEFAGMMLVAERDRLRGTKIRRGDVIRSRKADDAHGAAADQRQAADHEQSQPGIGGWRKYLGHSGPDRIACAVREIQFRDRPIRSEFGTHAGLRNW